MVVVAGDGHMHLGVSDLSIVAKGREGGIRPRKAGAKGRNEMCVRNEAPAVELFSACAP